MLIAQITDTHVRSSGDERRHLAEAIGWVGTRTPRPDAVVLTGDVTDGGEHEQYVQLRDILGRCAIPVYVVPGNHDRREPLRAVLPPAWYPGTSGERLHYAVDEFPVRLIGLDTTVYRWPGGVLDPAGLAWLDATLAAAPERPALLFMHHPPFRTGVNAADMFGFRGLAELRAVAARRPAVRRLIAGHIHCERQAPFGAALASTALSSTPQQVPELFERRPIGLRPEPAGLALHAWERGTFTTTSFVNAGNGTFVGRDAP